LVRFLRRNRPEYVALALVGALALADVVLALMLGRPPGAVIDTSIVLVAGAVALWRSPWLGLGIAAVAPVAGQLLGDSPISTWPVAGFVVFVACARGVPGLLGGLAAALGNCLATLLEAGQVGWGLAAAALAPLMFAFAGSTVREQRRAWASMARQVEQAATARESVIQQRIALERVRIARDLHDLLGHELALLSMNLGAAEVHLPPGADAALGDLTDARERLRAVLRETQRILSVLRAKHPTDTAPAAGYGRLGALIESFADAGLDVHAQIDPCPAELDQQVGTAVFRIVQEALANAQRHGRGPVELTVTSSPGKVAVLASNPLLDAKRRETDDGAHPSDVEGFGLVGMPERATSAGGTIAAGSADGRFVVRAVLPVDGVEDSA
jgi:signal transduction histidine kinase